MEMQTLSRIGESVLVEVNGQVHQGVVVRESWTESVGEMLVVSVSSNSCPQLRVMVPPAVLLESLG
ncbi:MAG TPA: hypothetical protein PKM12_05895 [Marmoricola sp.]|nr:hypothetical protein [Marmoricola sp.]